MIGLDVYISQITDLCRRTVTLVTLHLKLIYGDGELVASFSSLFEEIIYNEREKTSVMLAYFKYVI